MLSFGSWVTFGDQLGVETATESMQAAWDAGVTFFDNAEAYAGGQSEVIMGEVLREGDVITIDGASGYIYVGVQPVVRPEPAGDVATLLKWASEGA